MITKKNKVQNDTKKIALLGIKPGVGVTHTGILLGEFLKEKTGARVAVVEKNYHGDMESLGEMIYGCQEKVFTFRGVDYYSMSGAEELKEKALTYDYLIMDFGTQKKKRGKELELCEKKVVIGTLNWWEWQEYIRVAEYYKESMPDEDLTYVVSLGNCKLLSRVEKRLHSRVHFLGFQSIEGALSKEAERIFNTLI